jgi:hypothetical protein
MATAGATKKKKKKRERFFIHVVPNISGWPSTQITTGNDCLKYLSCFAYRNISSIVDNDLKYNEGGVRRHKSCCLLILLYDYPHEETDFCFIVRYAVIDNSSIQRHLFNESEFVINK